MDEEEEEEETQRRGGREMLHIAIGCVQRNTPALPLEYSWIHY